jgi:hypothetical protein
MVLLIKCSDTLEDDLTLKGPGNIYTKEGFSIVSGIL